MTIPDKISKVLNKLIIPKPILLGKGGEGYIYSYGRDAVIKIYNNTSKDYLQNLAKLQKFISKKNLPFSTPEIQEIGCIEGTYFTIENRLTGVSMDQKFPTLERKSKYKLLKNYYEAIKTLNNIEMSELPYGNIVQRDTTITDHTWQGFLIKKMKQRVEKAGERLRKDVLDLDMRLQQFEGIINMKLNTDKKYFVHADYFINQVLVNEKNEITAVLDISYHAVVGDKKLDVASVPFFYDIKDYLAEHITYLIELEKKDYGEIILKYNDIYKIYYCFYISNIYKYIPKFYDVVVKTLNDNYLWQKISKY